MITGSELIVKGQPESTRTIRMEGVKEKETGIREFTENIKKEIKRPDVEKAKNVTYEALIEENKEKIKEADSVSETKEPSEGLSKEEKDKIKEETGWSDDIIHNIRSMKEYEIYRKAGLHEIKINDRHILIRSDIDWNQTDEKGRTNTERIERGLAPLDKDGNSIELHHIGQHADSPLAELRFKEHRCDGNDGVLHDKNIGTEVHGEGTSWDNESQDYWKSRADYNEGSGN